jgi:hypothetical protein
MTAVLIVRTAEEDAVLGTVALARGLSRQQPVTVLFVGEALAAMHESTFRWSESFKGRDARAAIVRAAERYDLPFADRDRDHRWSDVRGLVAWAAAQHNVRVVACPIWCTLLGLAAPPANLDAVDESELADVLSGADLVVGSY